MRRISEPFQVGLGGFWRVATRRRFPQNVLQMRDRVASMAGKMIVSRVWRAGLGLDYQRGDPAGAGPFGKAVTYHRTPKNAPPSHSQWRHEN
jgi:hypothetical protein